jgi:uncharacterized zinc-type alcohol dehydrogenase-like protein
MVTVKAYGVLEAGGPLKETLIARRDLGPADVLIDIAYVGVCHTDIQHAHNPASMLPLVPGHEIAGIVSAVGEEVCTFAPGDRVGVGCMVDSCRTCPMCVRGLEQFCTSGYVRTYAGLGRDGKPTHGGYSEQIVVDEAFVVRVPDALPLEVAAPLMCAGITMYSPLRRWNAGPDSRVGILGFGGLGHVGTQIANALGATTTALDLSEDKRGDALRMGASDFRVVGHDADVTDLADAFDLIVSTIPSSVDFTPFVNMLGLGGTLVHVGASERPVSVAGAALRSNWRSVAGTRIGGIAQTQEMLDFCAEHDVRTVVETIGFAELNEAFERVEAGDVRYRFVVDVATLGSSAQS